MDICKGAKSVDPADYALVIYGLLCSVLLALIKYVWVRLLSRRREGQGDNNPVSLTKSSGKTISPDSRKAEIEFLE